MAESTKSKKLSVRLLIDELKNKVVLAESGKDFVDVLFSFLALPMGTIVRLLEKHQKSPQVGIGCFNNLYKSVSEMDLESFQTEACKQVLLYPRSVNLEKFRNMKLKIDDTRAVKYFVCSGFKESCRHHYSISNTEECECGEIVDSKVVKRVMNREIKGLEEEQVQGRILRKDNDGVFFSCKASSFIITDDLKVEASSMDNVLNTLRGLGYADTSKLSEILLHVGVSEVFFTVSSYVGLRSLNIYVLLSVCLCHQQVLTLLECFFTSDLPLTDTFLKKQSSLQMIRSRIPLSPTLQGSGDGAVPGQTITFKAFVRKPNIKILCVECGADFIDLLFTFLALPLESVWNISAGNISLGCIGNLFRSFKRIDASSSSKTKLPSFYSCPKQLLDVVTEQQEIYCSFKCVVETNNEYDFKFTRKMPPRPNSLKEKNQNMFFTNKTSVLYLTSFGFMKQNTRFLVTDDLVIKPKNLVSNISLLKLNMHLDKEDVEEHVITIGKLEAISLLRASLMTSSALTSSFWSLISKKAKAETQ
ncbi:hypothetical protein (DUF674) [Arabidopsis thaliana]|uniref:DUF674 family protein n=1 Tax=Arabidopsis thaliana TaxID=3702 RepID=Q6DYD0_ARATH|nr:hypothetical protein (DUF674) [Arabidopsis thaliana]AAT67574.1 hypothetical protein At3G09140 [Arabidopsis thaliana]AEE74727.1 hypothetical protein (DUF674) [Arabidopsis thaliana]|eukprot:NP_187526.2 hypothetical protein (DUF674) [Arabidopsis thaliana]